MLAFIIVTPFASLICCYQCLNHGRMPCIDTYTIDKHNLVLPEN
jgi:hypothetical protein